MKIIDLIQGDPNWLHWRSFKISSTDAASIMGVNPYETPLQCFERKLTGKEKPVNEAMQRGKYLEPMAREWMNLEYSSHYKPLCVESSLHPWLIASLDGWDIDADIPLLEIKVPVNGVRKVIPDYEYAQLQHQMLVTGAKQARYLSFHELEQSVIPVNRNDSFCSDLLVKSKEFYQRLLDCNPPEPGPKDWIECYDKIAIDLSKELEKVQERKKEIETAEETLKKAILDITGKTNTLVGNLRITKVLSKGRIEYDKIPELQGLNLDIYRKPYVESVRISFRKS